MEISQIRKHQNRRRKLEEFQRPPENFSYDQNQQAPIEDLQSLHRLKQVKLHDIYQNPQIESLLEFRNYLWAKHEQAGPIYYQYNKPIKDINEELLNARSYSQVNAYLKHLYMENQNFRKQREEADKTERGEMITEDEPVIEEQIPAIGERDMLTETSETNEFVRSQIEEFYELQNKLLLELYMERSYKMREEE